MRLPARLRAVHRLTEVGTRPRRHARERGSNLVEFALLFPVYLVIVAITFDYGWYFFIRSVAQTSVRAGCRAGAVIPPDDDPEDAARDAISGGMSTYTFSAVDCQTVGDSSCDIDVTTSGTSPSESLVCTISVDYPGLTGLIPMPEQVTARSTVLFELQR
jgi:Flp pilus assembly protein TadG